MAFIVNLLFSEVQTPHRPSTPHASYNLIIIFSLFATFLSSFFQYGFKHFLKLSQPETEIRASLHPHLSLQKISQVFVVFQFLMPYSSIQLVKIKQIKKELTAKRGKKDDVCGRLIFWCNIKVVWLLILKKKVFILAVLQLTQQQQHKMSQYSIQTIELQGSQSAQRLLDVLPPQEHPLMDPQFMQVYKTALSYSKMDLDLSLKFRNVKIYEKDYIHEVYSLGNSTLPHLVLLHGYGGTSLTFGRLFQSLSTRYQIHALDIFGMGLSSCGNWHDKMTREEVVSYYIDALEAWRQKVGVQKFVLAGHSLGGFIGCLYYERFSYRIQQIFFLSPAGTARWTDKYLENKKAKDGCFMCVGEIVWNCNFQPTKLLNYCLFGKYLLNKVVTQKLKLEKDEQYITGEYLRMLARKKKTSEMGFYILFQWPIQPEKCIEVMVRAVNPKIHIDFMYGDKDWMKPYGAKRLQADYKTIKVHEIENAGHQLLFDNPKKVASIMRDQLKVQLQYR